LDNFKVGFKFGDSWSSLRKCYCSCGAYLELNRRDEIVCGCGNKRFIDGGSYVRERRSHDGVYTSIRKDARGFKARKQEYIVNFKREENKVVCKLSHVWELDVDLPSRTLLLTKNGKEVTSGNESNWANINQFFKCADSELSVVRELTEDNIYHVLNYAYSKLGSRNMEYVSKMGRGLLRLIKDSRLPRLELFSNAGFGNQLSDIANVRDWMDSKETQPHRIMGVPKSLLRYVKEDADLKTRDIAKLATMVESMGVNNVMTVLQIFREEASVSALMYCYDTFSVLHRMYDYKDVRRLALYVAREVKLEQGIESPSEACNLLRDTCRMCRDMEVATKERFPKSLKKNHDIAQMNYKVQADEIQNRKMKEVTEQEDYSGLAKKSKSFSVIIPQSATEVIQEGSS